MKCKCGLDFIPAFPKEQHCLACQLEQGKLRINLTEREKHQRHLEYQRRYRCRHPFEIAERNRLWKAKHRSTNKVNP